MGLAFSLQSFSMWLVSHNINNMDVGFDKLDEMSNVVCAEIVEDVFDRKGRGKLEQQAQQQEDERRHVDGGGGGSNYIRAASQWVLSLGLWTAIGQQSRYASSRALTVLQTTGRRSSGQLHHDWPLSGWLDSIAEPRSAKTCNKKVRKSQPP
jgi:hypothetical protein